MLLLDSQELEYLLEHLGHPETLKEKKFQEWLLDNDHRQLFERVRDYREAYLRVDKGEMIDLAKEWEQFEVNVQKKSRWGMRRIGVVAASVLIFLLIGTLWQPTEIETVKVVREAELIGKKSATTYRFGKTNCRAMGRKWHTHQQLYSKLFGLSAGYTYLYRRFQRRVGLQYGENPCRCRL